MSAGPRLVSGLPNGAAPLREDRENSGAWVADASSSTPEHVEAAVQSCRMSAAVAVIRRFNSPLWVTSRVEPRRRFLRNGCAVPGRPFGLID